MSAVRSKNLAEWVDAAERLVLNSTKNVDCPDCGKPALQVRDVEYGWGHTKGLERYLICSHCGAYNAVNMRHARSCSDTHVTEAATGTYSD
jgi:C4-type Zn-finger protein